MGPWSDSCATLSGYRIVTAPRGWLVCGDAPMSDVRCVTGWYADLPMCLTLSSYVRAHLGRAPTPGDRVSAREFEVVVNRVRDQTVCEALIRHAAQVAAH